MFLDYLELGTTKPSSTQQILVFSSPTSTTQAALKPQPNTEDTDSCHMKTGWINNNLYYVFVAAHGWYYSLVDLLTIED